MTFLDLVIFHLAGIVTDLLSILVVLGVISAIVYASHRKSSSKPEPTTHDDAAASLDAEWADIEEIIKAENANQKGN